MHLQTRWLAALLFAPAVGIALVAAQAPAPAGGLQDPQVTFRLDVDYVEVDAVVTDAAGSIVRGLTADDFEILEDGDPQEVEAFTFVDLPVEPARPPLFAETPIEPDVRSNAVPFEGRLYILVLDDYNTMALRTGRVRAAARRFVEEHIGENDLAAVLHTSGRPSASQDFTNSRPLLLSAIEQFAGRKTQISSLERFDITDRDTVEELQLLDDRWLDPTDYQKALEAEASLHTITEVARFLSSINGRRKALVLISEGIDYNIFDPFNLPRASTIMDETRQAIAEATRSNTSIYAVDPRGLVSGIADADVYELQDDLVLGFDNPYNRLMLSQYSLRTLADQTNGFAAINSNDFDRMFERIVAENSTYYLLGYYPTNTERDGRYREIEVRLKDPTLRVRARKGYVAPRTGEPPVELTEAVPGTSDELRAVLSTPISVSGLTLAVSAVPYLGTAPNASVAIIVEVDGRGLAFAEQDGRWVELLELSLLAVDRRGRIEDGDRQEADMSLRPETYQAVAATGVRFVSRLELPPGQIQMRIGARESGLGAAGTVAFDLPVPDFRRAPLMVSGIALTSHQAAGMPTAQPDEVFGQALPAQPTTVREFARDDVLVTFAEVYDNELGPPHRVDISTTLRAEDGQFVFQTSEARSSGELEGERGGYGVRAVIPLSDVTPGRYLLAVEARSRLEGAASASQQTVITVR